MIYALFKISCKVDAKLIINQDDDADGDGNLWDSCTRVKFMHGFPLTHLRLWTDSRQLNYMK